jgi:indolepyruvate ferredoxin oxidoreductase beta subunit
LKPAQEQLEQRGWRIIIVGTGGQGVLTAARLLCEAFVDLGHEVVSGQLHGMAQRGGSVQSSIMIDSGISPVMAQGAADYLLGLEPVEAARALPFVSAGTACFVNTTPVIPYVLGQETVLHEEEAKYPDIGHLLDHIRAVTASVYAFDATQQAAQAGSPKTLNILMLGCLLGSGSLPCTPHDFWMSVTRTMPPNLADINRQAFGAGVEMGRKLQISKTCT